MHELRSDWHGPYTESISPYFLSRGIRWSLLHFGTFIHSWICATQCLHTDMCDILYLCKYIKFQFTSRTLQCPLHGTYMFGSNWNHGGISRDVHFTGHLRPNRTNVWSDKRNMQSGGEGARTGSENRCFTPTTAHLKTPLSSSWSLRTTPHWSASSRMVTSLLTYRQEVKELAV